MYKTLPSPLARGWDNFKVAVGQHFRVSHRIHLHLPLCQLVSEGTGTSRLLFPGPTGSTSTSHKTTLTRILASEVSSRMSTSHAMNTR